jgi:uncharacterized protein (TIGR01777 family)
METIIIAGGTGLIGKQLVAALQAKGHEVRCLTRNQTLTEKGLYHWDPYHLICDERVFENATVVINLAGAGIADKRWTSKRMEELISSRVDTTKALLHFTKDCKTLTHYISASGIICYGFENDTAIYNETAVFGTDTLSHITELWEAAADTFGATCAVTKIRISVVLAKEGGALKPIALPIKYGFGTILGAGKQAIPWISISDLVNMFVFVAENKLSGTYNANAGNTTNEQLTRTIAEVFGKRIWLPKLPGVFLKLVLGKMSSVVLKGLRADNGLIQSKGFVFDDTDLKKTITKIYA